MISDIAYSLVSVVSYMDWEHGFGAWIRCTSMAIAKGKQETVYHEECIYTAVCTAIALQSIHLFQSLLQKHCIFSPTHPCLYIHIATLSLQVISNRNGSLLSAVAMGLNIPLQGSLFGLPMAMR